MAVEASTYPIYITVSNPSQCPLNPFPETFNSTIFNINDNDNDKVFYSTLIIHFIFNTAIDVFAY